MQRGIYYIYVLFPLTVEIIYAYQLTYQPAIFTQQMNYCGEATIFIQLGIPDFLHCILLSLNRYVDFFIITINTRFY